MMRVVEVQSLGEVQYSRGLDLQAQLVVLRRNGEVLDQLLLLEHPHVITQGTGSHQEHVLLSPVELERRGIQLHAAGRGGDVTYHGPGQLVGYPILDLKPHRKDLHRYLRDLEEVIIRTLAYFGLNGVREEGLTGVWCQGGKVAAMGVRVSSGWITSHGFALNVAPDLAYFDTIVPCGILDRRVTSMEALLGASPSREEVTGVLVSAFGTVFDARMEQRVTGPTTGGERLPESPGTAPSSPSGR